MIVGWRKLITVVMATHNGSDTIGQTLEALVRTESPPGGWRLVIVNNASSDSTAAIIEHWKERLPIVLLTEDRLGKNRALNTGLSVIRDEFVVLCDDDVLPDPDWLLEWRRVADAYPEIGIFGGAIIPKFQIPPPEYCLKNHDTMAAMWSATRPDRPEGIKADDPVWDVYGCNMAMCADVARNFRFDEDFMVGPDAFLGDESDFVRRVARAGYKVGFAPTARVHHVVGCEQVRWKWMLRRFFRSGKSHSFIELKEQPLSVPSLFGAPRFLIRQFLAHVPATLVAIFVASRPAMFAQMKILAFDFGRIYQARVMAKERGRPRQVCG